MGRVAKTTRQSLCCVIAASIGWSCHDHACCQLEFSMFSFDVHEYYECLLSTCGKPISQEYADAIGMLAKASPRFQVGVLAKRVIALPITLSGNTLFAS